MIGSGQFGKVHQGRWTSPKGEGKVDVALKTLKEGAGEQDKVKFLQEAAIMGQFSHPNVVKLHGVVTEGEPVSETPCLIYLRLYFPHFNNAPLTVLTVCVIIINVLDDDRFGALT